ncbi:lipoic acid synthetase [Syntrophus gentianae]|uniref:Lipoyl synthase n=2 Tax=Syntrophus gentianae TaxID=43775 RepID=A0A1H7Y1S9_9BACT|nr:lipoyl synthase [Syntrophus gentianae]SEM40112.1 lipoic acid synthetase [Syntrophus gentianae]
MMAEQERPPRLRKPSWLRRKLPTGPVYEQVRSLIKSGALHTVCQEAKCPNQWECFSSRTATFLIMGSRCTRRCRFCAVEHGPLEPPDPQEPAKVADAAKALGLRYVVVTSVTRDDLPDGGASVFAATIRAIRGRIPDGQVEVLIPDFQGDAEALRTVVEARPDVLNHNLETVPRLYPAVRPEAEYQRSLKLLSRAKALDCSLPTKSGLMLGLGESSEEIRDSLQDLLAAGCRLLTLGQYLQPSTHHLPVERFVPPDEFARWRDIALEMGFSQVASGPFVRSSYHARDLYLHA